METLEKKLSFRERLQVIKDKRVQTKTVEHALRDEEKQVQEELDQLEDSEKEENKKKERLFKQEQQKKLDTHRKNDATGPLRNVITNPYTRYHGLLITVPLHKTTYKWLWNALHVPTLELFAERLFALVTSDSDWKEHRKAFDKKQQSYRESEEFGELYFPFHGLGRITDEKMNEEWMAQFLKHYFYDLGNEWLTVPLILGKKEHLIYPIQAHYILTTSAILAYKELEVAYENSPGNARSHINCRGD